MCRIVRNDELVAPSSSTMGGDQLPVEDRIRMRTKIFSATTREGIVASWVLTRRQFVGIDGFLSGVKHSFRLGSSIVAHHLPVWGSIFLTCCAHEERPWPRGSKQWSAFTVRGELCPKTRSEMSLEMSAVCEEVRLPSLPPRFQAIPRTVELLAP